MFTTTQKRPAKLSCHLYQSDLDGKCYPRTGHEGPEEEYSHRHIFPLTSTLDVVGASDLTSRKFSQI